MASRTKILLAEADSNISDAIESYFTKTGLYEVTVVMNGPQVLPAAQTIQPDIIILEKRLRGIDGLEAWQRVKESIKTKHIPVIFLAADDDVVDKVLGLKMGASDYVAKPFSLRELEARIEAVLRHTLPERLGINEEDVSSAEPQQGTGTHPAIEIRESGDVTSNHSYELLVAGDPLEVASIGYYGRNSEGGDGFGIRLSNREVIMKLGEYGVSEFGFNLEYLELKYRVKGLPLVGSIWIAPKDKEIPFTIDFNYDPDLSKWQRLYSFVDYYEELSKHIDELNNPDIELQEFKEEEDTLNGFAVTFPYYSGDIPIATEIDRHAEILRILHEVVEAALAASSYSNLISISFDFPKEVSVSCEQYLIYFAQFLRDLGVEADTSITHNAGQVLFTVTPIDKRHALDKIRAALDVYLHLPSNPISDTTNESIAIQRLESNILRLRSDLKLAAAELQAKDATIQAQQLTIEVQKGLLNGEIIFDSLKDITPKPQDKDKEEVLGGVVSLVPLDTKAGVHINIPEIFRKLKKLFEDKE